MSGWKHSSGSSGSVLPSALVFHGKKTLTQTQFEERKNIPKLVADVQSRSVQLPILVRHSLFGIEGLLLQQNIARVPLQNRFVFRVRIFDVMMCEAKHSDATVVVFTQDLAPKAVTERGSAAFLGYGMYVMTARSPTEATFLCRAVIKWSDQWSEQGRLIVLQNLSAAQFQNPTVLQIADRHGKRPVQVLIRWLLTKWARHEGSIRLPKTLSPLQIAAVYGTDEWQFEAEELNQLDPLSRDFRYQPLQIARTSRKSPQKSQLDRTNTTQPKQSPKGILRNTATSQSAITNVENVKEQRKKAARRRMSFQVAKKETAITALYSMATTTREELMNTPTFTRQQIEEIFKVFDKKCPTGLVSKFEFAKVAAKLLKVQIFDTGAYVDLIYEVFDYDGNGDMSLADYRMFLASVCKDKPADRLRAIFDAFATMHEGEEPKILTDNLVQIILLANALNPDGQESVTSYGLPPEGLADYVMLELCEDGDVDAGINMEGFIENVLKNDMLNDLLVLSEKDKTMKRKKQFKEMGLEWDGEADSIASGLVSQQQSQNGSLASFATNVPNQWDGNEGDVTSPTVAVTTFFE